MDTAIPSTRRRRARRIEEETLDEAVPMRPPMRDDNPRARAERRTAELLGGDAPAIEESSDEFFIPPEIIPDGWTYEWKRRLVQGQEEPAYQVALARTGWEAVPCKRHPEMMPLGWQGATIERKGMVLMERPAAVTERVEQLNRQRARNQVRVKEQQLNAAPPGVLEKEYSDPRTRPQIKKSYEPMPVPADET